MNLNLITLANVKNQLGLNKSTYDTQITAMLPIVSSDVRRILNCKFDIAKYVVLTNGSDEFTTDFSLAMGQVIDSPALPDDTYITAYDPNTSTYTMSAAATTDGTYFYPTILIAQWPAISKMIFYKISKQSTDSATQEKYQSITYGNVSKTFSGGEINSKYDYPQILLDDLGVPFAVAE